VYVADEDALYFTTVPRPGPAGPRVDIRRMALEDGVLTTVRADANAANGMTLAPDGRLLVCEQGSMSRRAAITLVDRASGRTETLADAWRGLPLNSPSDVVVKSDGTVWFTDPSYGHLQGFRPSPTLPDRVYRYDPAAGDVAVVAAASTSPNGLAFAPDERTLYVGDSGAIHAPGDYDPARPATCWRSPSPTAPGWSRSAPSAGPCPASRTASRSTRPDASTCRPRTASGSSARPAA
jgi:gluconolactonase